MMIKSRIRNLKLQLRICNKDIYHFSELQHSGIVEHISLLCIPIFT
jgi:hypothetical protein